jgi:hypothetical protein
VRPVALFTKHFSTSRLRPLGQAVVKVDGAPDKLPDGSWSYQQDAPPVTVLGVVWANESPAQIAEELDLYHRKRLNVVLVKVEWKGQSGETAIRAMAQPRRDFQDWIRHARVTVLLQHSTRRGWEIYLRKGEGRRPDAPQSGPRERRRDRAGIRGLQIGGGKCCAPQARVEGTQRGDVNPRYASPSE